MSFWKAGTLLAGIIFSFATTLPGQTSGHKLPLIDKERLQQDFSTFRANLEKTHPALYRYRSRSEITTIMDSCYQSVTHNMTQLEFYKKIKFILSAIQDGHLASDIPAVVVEYIEEKAKVFPLKLKFNSTKVYILCDTDNLIPSGSELLAINSEPIERIRQKLYEHIVSDGAIQTNKAWVLSNSFWFYYLLVYGEKPSFSIQYKNNTGEIKTRSLQSDFRKNINCQLEEPQTEKNLQLVYKSNSTALLIIKTFSHQELSESKEDFTSFLQASFKEIKNKGVENLIIDLRGNQGGRDVYGSLLYSYLTHTPFVYYKTLATIDKTLLKEEHPNLGVQMPSEHNFRGKVYFLINGLSFSTTAEFCSIAKSNNRGIFIGEETGGGYYGNNGGHFIEALLPNTKIVIYIPATQYVMEVRQTQFTNRGIIPDVAVEPTADDLINNRDVQLNAALQLINKGNSR